MELQEVWKEGWEDEFIRELQRTKNIIDALLESAKIVSDFNNSEIAEKINEIISNEKGFIGRSTFMRRIKKELKCKAQSADLLTSLGTDSKKVDTIIYELKLEQHRK